MMNKKKVLNKQNGITLVALVITIVILIILASVTLSATIGENGLIKKAQEAKDRTTNAIKAEEEEMNKLEQELDTIIDNSVNSHIWNRSGHYVICSHCDLKFEIGKSIINYKTKLSENKVEITPEKSGYIEKQVLIQEQDISWLVLGIADENKDGINESLLITTDKPVNNIILYGATGYLYGVDELNRVCKELYSSDIESARSISIEDINEVLKYEPEGGTYTTDGAVTWQTTGNFTTKLKELSIWNTIKSVGTKTPDGINTEEALGEYVLNGYLYRENGEYLICNINKNDTRYPIKEIKNELELIVGAQNDFQYLVASRGGYVAHSMYSIGIANVSNGGISNCGDLFGNTGLEKQIEAKLRPVVSLKQIP